MKTMPRHLEFMAAETYKYFCHSSARQMKYRNLYITINVGEEPLKIMQLSDTRWMAIAPCLARILDQYHELKLHFQKTMDEDKNYTAGLLFNMYSNHMNKLFLEFLQPVVSDVNRVNKMFQSDQCSVTKLSDDLMALYRSLLQRVMLPRRFNTWESLIYFELEDDRNQRLTLA